MKSKKLDLFFKFSLIVICILLIAVGVIIIRDKDENFSFKLGRYMVFNDAWNCENTGEKIYLPCKVEEIEPGEELVLTKILPMDLNGINCLSLRSYQGACSVYINDELREEYNDEQYRKYSKFPPTATLLVELYPKDAGRTIKIVYNCSNKNFVGTASEVVIGEKDAIIRTLLKSYAPALMIALALIVFGLACIPIYFVMYKESDKHRAILYLGIFLVMLGIWLIVSSKIKQIFLGNITGMQYIELWLVHLLPIPIVFFFAIKSEGRYKRITNTVLSIAYINFALINILHFTGACDKAYTLISGNILAFFVAFYLVGCIILEFKNKHTSEAVEDVVSFSFFIVFTVIDLILYYINRQWTMGILISAGALMFAIFTLIFAVNEYIRTVNQKTSLIAESAAKDQFFATMSHDIRTPINAIIGMNEMIQRESKEPDTLGYARDIERASDTLMSIVNNILDFSKLRDGKYELSYDKFLFATTIADIVKMTDTLAVNKGLRLRTIIDESIPRGLIGDENALKRIITNLTSNAVKYTKRGEVIFIAKAVEAYDVTVPVDAHGFSESSKKEKKVKIHFEVRDTGIGIREEDIPHVFDVFSRMDSVKNKNIQGTGLGLAITNALASSMGSEINVSSVYGEGSCFSFDVDFTVYDSNPVGKFSIETAGEEDIKEHNKRAVEKDVKDTYFNENKSILIVDDTELNLKVMKKLLKLNGVNVDTASSGQECITYCSTTRYDLILLDDMMPEMDGRETLSHLKSLNLKTLEGIPIVVLTANAGPGVRDMYLSLGFTDYISKPVKATALNDLLWQYLG